MDVIHKIAELWNGIDWKDLGVSLKEYKIGIYYEGDIYFSKGKRAFSSLTLEEKKYSIFLDYNRLLEEDPILYLATFIKEGILKKLYLDYQEKIPNELLGLDYPQNYLNLDYIHFERSLFVKAIRSTNKYEKINYLRMILNVRDLRTQMIGEEFSQLEDQFQTIYGLSEYGMWKVLGQFQKVKQQNYIKHILNTFAHLDKTEFTFRKLNPNSGLLLLVLMDTLGYSMIDIWKIKKMTIYDFCCKKISFIHEPVSFKNDQTLIKKLEQFHERSDELLKDYFAKEPKKCFGQYQIYNFDPDNMFKRNHNIYHGNYVVLKNLTTSELEYFSGPIVTKIMENSLDIVTTYYYLINKIKKK